MDDQGLRSLLEQLHTELEHTQSVDQKGRELLNDLDNDIRGLLLRTQETQAHQTGSGTTAQDPQTLLERLEETIRYLEVTHPTLTNTLAKISESLSNAGI